MKKSLFVFTLLLLIGFSLSPSWSMEEGDLAEISHTVRVSQVRGPEDREMQYPQASHERQEGSCLSSVVTFLEEEIKGIIACPVVLMRTARAQLLQGDICYFLVAVLCDCPVAGTRR